MNAAVAYLWAKSDVIPAIVLIAIAVLDLLFKGVLDWRLPYILGGAVGVTVFDLYLAVLGRLRLVGPEAVTASSPIPVEARVEVLEDQVARMAVVLRRRFSSAGPLNVDQALKQLEGEAP